MKVNDGTLRRTLYATMPLLLWAGHFAAMYLLAVLHSGPAAKIVISVLALGACAWMLWVGARAIRRPTHAFHERAMAANAVLAAIAIVWTCVPLVLLHGRP